MFIGQSSLDRWLSVCRLDRDPLLIVEIGDKVETFFGVTLGIEFLCSLKLFVQLLRALKAVDIHLSLLCHNLSIWPMLLLREIEPNREIKRAHLRLHHALHAHESSRVLHERIWRLHKLRHSLVHHHHGRIHPGSRSHHHFLSWCAHAHSHLHPCTHHHLEVRVPHLSLDRLSLLDDINRHGKETELATKSWTWLLWLWGRRHQWR